MAENQEPQSPEELVKYIASNLVENTDEIKIETVEEENKVILKLTVDENDKGKIIGKNGKIAKSIRNVLKLASTKDKSRYILEIL
ncbi:MAG: RNA-binding protein [Chloroflexi bacterium]|nr:RNA-binding protein [Chloroflexota bacterium]|tara:strand:+ start:1109 stop:1363 length:255 start_codon:yes stop_codon:yes gene_type:complete